MVANRTRKAGERMKKKEANNVAAAMSNKRSGYTLTGLECLDRGDWTVTGIRQADGESVTFSTWDEWHAAANGATPTPGARLKRPELGATVQHSVTLPESCWQDIEALGVSPKGKNVRSEGVFKLWQAWKAQEGEA